MSVLSLNFLHQDGATDAKRRPSHGARRATTSMEHDKTSPCDDHVTSTKTSETSGITTDKRTCACLNHWPVVRCIKKCHILLEYDSHRYIAIIPQPINHNWNPDVLVITLSQCFNHLIRHYVSLGTIIKVKAPANMVVWCDSPQNCLLSEIFLFAVNRNSHSIWVPHVDSLTFVHRTVHETHKWGTGSRCSLNKWYKKRMNQRSRGQRNKGWQRHTVTLGEDVLYKTMKTPSAQSYDWIISTLEATWANLPCNADTHISTNALRSALQENSPSALTAPDSLGPASSEPRHYRKLLSRLLWTSPAPRWARPRSSVWRRWAWSSACSVDSWWTRCRVLRPGKSRRGIEKQSAI